MVTKEIQAGAIILRIHDEMCQPLDDIHTASISHIVSEAYRKRSLPSPPTTDNASSEDLQNKCNRVRKGVTQGKKASKMVFADKPDTEPFSFGE